MTLKIAARFSLVKQSWKLSAWTNNKVSWEPNAINSKANIVHHLHSIYHSTLNIPSIVRQWLKNLALQRTMYFEMMKSQLEPHIFKRHPIYEFYQIDQFNIIQLNSLAVATTKNEMWQQTKI